MRVIKEDTDVQTKPAPAERVRALYERIKDFDFDEEVKQLITATATTAKGKGEKKAPPVEEPKTFLDRYVSDYGYEKEGEITIPKNHVDAYLRFMCVKVVMEQEGQKATPSTVVDAVWHAHLVFTRSYHRLCAALGQPFIHHDPAEGTKEAEGRYQRQYLATQDLYETAFYPEGMSFQELWEMRKVWPVNQERFDPDEQFVFVTKRERDEHRSYRDKMLAQGWAKEYGSPRGSSSFPHYIQRGYTFARFTGCG